MSKSCVYKPSIGKELHSELKKKFDYRVATNTFLLAINKDFKEKYKDTLRLDSEGVPSFESLMKVPYVEKFIGRENLKSADSKNFGVTANNTGFYTSNLEKALSFNTNHEDRNKFVALVKDVDYGLQVTLVDKTPEAIQAFKDQYSANAINNNVSNALSRIGINTDVLTRYETSDGSEHPTKDIAESFAKDLSNIVQSTINKDIDTTISIDSARMIANQFTTPWVERCLHYIENNISSFEDETDEAVEGTSTEEEAREVLANIISDNIAKNEIDTSMDNIELFQNAINSIKDLFNEQRYLDVTQAVVKGNESIDSAAQEMLSNIIDDSLQSKENYDLEESKELDRLGELKNRTKRIRDILKEAIKTEVKRAKITKGNTQEAAHEATMKLAGYLDPDANIIEGIYSYGIEALDNLRGLLSSIKDAEVSDTEIFSHIRSMRTYLQSYGGFIDNMSNALLLEENREDNLLSKEIEVDGIKVSAAPLIKELKSISDEIALRYSNKALPALAQFLKPFMGEEIVVAFGKDKGKKITVESLLESADKDISILDRWLDSMTDSSDVLLQLLGKVVHKANDNTRLRTIDSYGEITKLRLEAERKGITDYEWMFEKYSDGSKTGNYISAVNTAQFEKDLKELNEALDEKYGKNPSGEDLANKMQERKEWAKIHSASEGLYFYPNAVYYANKDFENLSEDKRHLYNSFIDLKKQYDQYLPNNEKFGTRAIQQRKSSGQRLFDSSKSFGSLFTNLKESIKSALLDREDDDQIFGNTKSGLTDFEGNEFNMLPILYVNKLKNPDELSDDIFGSLMSYAYMANQYDEIEKVIDPLEVARDVAKERKVRKTSGGKVLEERIKTLGVTVTNKIFNTKPDIIGKLDDFFESQVYHKYLKDSGSFNIFGNEVNTNKLVNFLLGMSSTAQLGFNYLANVANAITGSAMIHIEAASGEYFNFKELANADKEYGTNVLASFNEMYSRNKTSKLSLFDTLFDVRQDFSNSHHASQKKNLLRKIFGSGIEYMGQGAGDHWMYNRVAIAIAKREKVLLNGKETNLWDALEVKNKYSDSDEIKELNHADIKNLDGSPLNISDISRKIAHVNQGLFGIYNEDDANAANRIAMGRLLQQYRKWVKPQMNKRFQGAQYSISTGQFEEGYYRTFGRILNELIRGKVQLSVLKDELTPHEMANIKRSIFEITQFFAVWALANFIDWKGDDKHRPWAMKLAEYASQRAVHELGGLTPSTIMFDENLKTVKTPIPAISSVQNLFNLVNSIIDPRDWTDEMTSGPYKGSSTLEKNLMKAPIPGISQYKQISKFTGDLDTSIQYYMRPSMD